MLTAIAPHTLSARPLVLRPDSVISLTVETAGDAVLSVTITSYGLTGSIFNSDRFPHMWPVFRMAKSNGDVIWTDKVSMTVWQDVQKQVEPRPIPDLFNDPVLLEKQIRKVTEMVVEDSMRSL